MLHSLTERVLHFKTTLGWWLMLVGSLKYPIGTKSCGLSCEDAPDKNDCRRYR